MSETITQEGERVQWTAVYWRHYSKCKSQFPTYEEAVQFLCTGEERGTMSSEDILRPDGSSTGWDWLKHKKPYDPTSECAKMCKVEAWWDD